MVFNIWSRSDHYLEKDKHIINEALDCKHAMINYKYEASH